MPGAACRAGFLNGEAALDARFGGSGDLIESGYGLSEFPLPAALIT